MKLAKKIYLHFYPESKVKLEMDKSTQSYFEGVKKGIRLALEYLKK